MKINRATLTNGKQVVFEESIDFSHIEFDPTHIRAIKECNVKALVTDYETILRVELSIDAKVIGVCSYTLEDVELNLRINDELDFTDDETDEDNYYEKDVVIDLDKYILGIVTANIPVKIVKKGAKLPENGKGYRVLTQDEYDKEKQSEVDHRWDKLDDIEVDD